jgi:type IV pilus assembly protein PilQ
LAREEEGGIVRIAPASRLAAEAEDERRLREARSTSREPQVTTFRLSYARAQEMAPLVKRLLSPRGDVVYDTRTNTLIVID